MQCCRQAGIQVQRTHGCGGCSGSGGYAAFVTAKDSVEPRLQPEVQQEPDFKARCTEIIEELALGHGGELRTRFRLDDNLVIDDHVDALHGEDVLLVRDVNAEFSRDAMPTLDQLTLEGHHIDVFEKAESERVVHLEERTDDRGREALFG